MIDNHEADSDWIKRHELLFRVRLSSLYHRKRERFFDLLDRWFKFATVVLGAASIARVLDLNPISRDVILAVITMCGALSLVFSFSERARRHSDFAKDYGSLESDIVAKGEIDCVLWTLGTWEGKLAQVLTSLRNLPDD